MNRLISLHDAVLSITVFQNVMNKLLLTWFALKLYFHINALTSN